MARFIKDHTKSKGTAPGSFIFIGNQKMDKPVIRLIEYNADNLTEKTCSTLQEAAQNHQAEGVTWINIDGLHDLTLMQKVSDIFGYHPLLMEDIMNTDQRPKFDDGNEYDAFILKMLYREKHISAEQVTIILGEHYVLTIQEKLGDMFEPVRERIRQKKGRVRLNHNDYLAYALMDSIADHYMLLIENIGAEIEDLEDLLFTNNTGNLTERIHKYKIEINYLRKSIRPVKDIVLNIIKSENTWFQDTNKQYLRDLQESLMQTTDTIELYGSMLSDQLNTHNTNMGNRMNEVMKVLTIFASIFIPLTFIAGIYGMNFEHMPELSWPYAYPLFWLAVIIMGSGLLLYFKRKKWF